MPARPTQATAQPGADPPSRRAFGWLVVTVLALHLALLLGLTGALDWRLPTAEAVRVVPLQTRWVPPVTAPAPATAPGTTPPRSRIATEPRPQPVYRPVEPVPATAEAHAAPTQPPVAEETVPTPHSPPAEVATTAPPPASVSEPTPAAAPDTASATTASATASLPPIPLGALPPPVLLSYRLTGQEKGLTYHANGELRWQHNEAAYALSLSVKAFLVGSRHWRSQGEITSTGLTPTRFSDSWRSERAAHFDRAKQRVVFSNNAPTATLESGAQDQISLYVQLAAAMAGAPQRFQPGTRLQVQTVTTRDAMPWLLTLEQPENLVLDGQTVPTAKWVCQPRNRFDAQVEFWVSAQYAWMPVRIRITQVSGSFIDLVLRGQEALPPLPAAAPAG